MLPITAEADTSGNLSNYTHSLGKGAPFASVSAAQHQPTQAENHSQGLAPEHLKKLRESALTDQQIEALPWSTGLNGRLQIPYLRPDGSPEQCHNGKAFIRERLTAAEIEADPKGGKYKSPYGNGCRVYHSHRAIAAGNYEQRLADRYTTLRITEGELKTESATVHDAKSVTIGLGGVSSWRDRYDGGKESRPLVEFDEIELEGREVRLCFDSDLNKPQVLAELKGLSELLQSKGARVLIEVLPNDLNGDRLGVDDLIYRHGAECFRRIAAIARTPFKTKRKDGEDVLVWAFSPEPIDTRERNAYLSGLAGRHWRRSADGKDHWHQWTGTHWEAVAGDDVLASKVERFMELQQWKNRELATTRSLLAAFRRSIEPASDAAAAGLLPFLNGCLRLEDAVLLPHNHENGNSWVLPYEYDPEAACPDTEKFLLDRLGDSDSVAVFRAFARCLLVGDRLKSFLEIIGPSNTGKTVLANLLVALVGNSNTAAGTLQRLEDRAQRFETLKLRGRRLAIFSEAQDFAGQLQTLKALTGGDPIAAEVKGGRHLDFTFTGGVVLVGNGPIRASDPSGAVINRRRSLLVQKVVAAAAERPMLDPDGRCGWRGELAAELPGLVNWCLAMPAAEAKTALARDINSEARANAEAEVLLATESLAEWAEHALAWNEGGHIRVGHADDDADQFAYANYLRWLMRQGRNCRPLALRSFKAKLVDLLRDTLGLALPPGSTSKGDYRVRGVGSVIPNLRMRFSTEEGDGVIMHGFKARSTGTDKQPCGTDAERVGNGKTPIGNGWNGWNGSNEVAHEEENSIPVFSHIAMGSDLSVPAVPSVPYKGSYRSASVPEIGFTVPVAVPAPSIDLIPPPAEQIERVMQRQAKPQPPAHRAPSTAAEWVEAALAELRLAPNLTHLPELVTWVKAHPANPGIAQGQLAGALERLQRDDREAEQQGLALEVA